MYKYVSLIILEIMFAEPILAAEWNDTNCTNRGGTILTAKDGTKFCRSNKSMNWWSANVWCQKHGGLLASITSWCPGTPTKVGESCVNGRDRVWLRETTASAQAAFQAVDYHVYTETLSHTGAYQPTALCK